jgi:uncharacterized protein
MLKVLIAGSHGMIGSALTERLETLGHSVTRLVRGKAGEGDVSWYPSPTNSSINLEGLEGFDAVVHVGGLSIAERRWTEGTKEKLWNSRIVSSEILTRSLLEITGRPKVFVCASAIGYYGDRGDDWLDETSDAGTGFLAELCQRWEEVTKPAAESGIRTVNLRSGIVLSPDGGTLKLQIPLFKLCMGGRLGDGQQFTSWISLDDEVGAIIHAIETDSLSGPVNLVAPNPVRNIDYTQILGEVLNRPTKIPAPRWMIATGLGTQLTDEVLLASQRVEPKKLRATGFRFRDMHLRPALTRMFAEQAKRAAADNK